MNLLARSAKNGQPQQTYQDHINGVFERAEQNIKAMCEYTQEELARSIELIVLGAACYHDLGKLDHENQEVLTGQKKAAHLPINHVDAGVAYLRNQKETEAAILTFSHHHELPSIPNEMMQPFPFRDLNIKEHIDIKLDDYLFLHKSMLSINLEKACHLNFPDALSRRLAFSCLVDADHSDAAHCHKTDYQPRWEERLRKLDDYVRSAYEENGKNDRNELRNQIYLACKSEDKVTNESILYCDSPVGTGKTTAIMAHLLQAAIKKQLRHIIVVLPFTNIITQSVKVYRKALVLDGEDPELIVAQHDHQADFSSYESRELAALWHSPIIVTTAVQFFETLGSNKPARLRKLHELPGSGIFIDESHAAIPTWLWPQAWIWLEKLTKNWGCHGILASGTTAKFWEIEDFVDDKKSIPELIPDALRAKANEYEKGRIKLNFNWDKVDSGTPIVFDTIPSLIDFVISKEGPRIIVMNTVQSAAYLAKEMQLKGLDVLHLSTALTPKDREPIINEVYERLEIDIKTQKLKYQPNWTLVATSCVEAGLNFSFRNGFAELRSPQSYLQIDGRVNREGEYTDSEMWCFIIDDTNAKKHPGFKTSQKIFRQLIESGLLGRLSITELITETVKREIKEDRNEKIEGIQKHERNHQYPETAAMCKIIDSDTRLVVMDSEIINILESGGKLKTIDLIRNSVQIWSTKIDKLGLVPIRGHAEIYKWPNNTYDPKFLGYMKTVLDYEELKSEVLII